MTAPRIGDARRFRVLVVGGAGTFGARLVDAILASTDWGIVVAGRNGARLETFMAARRAGAAGRLACVTLDASRVTAAALAGTGAHAVVDVAGPFQGGCRVLPAAAIAAGLPYVDIADARAFVAGFAPALDDAARTAGVVAITGASSTPALSNAALDALTRGWSRIDQVTVAISPGNRAPRGLAVVQAILSWAGQPVRLLQDGRWVERPGWGMTRRCFMPGLGHRWLSLCETPDLDIVPARLEVQRTAVFLAGLELPVLHLGLAAASLAVRMKMLRTLRPLAGALRAVADLLRPFGTDRGGMLVAAEGLDADGHAVRASWSLVAEGADGPSIPILPALAALRAIADGTLTEGGAQVCVGLLPLAALEREMRRYRIATSMTTERAGIGVFPRALGAGMALLPPAVGAVHAPGWWSQFSGRAEVLGPDTRIARAVARLFGFPGAARDIPVRVTIAADGASEVWTRDFVGRVFRSRLAFRGVPGEVEERFGPFRFRLLLAADEHGITMRTAGWWFGPLPLPRCLAPASIATETVDDTARFRFDVPIDLPLGLGRVVHYRGWLSPDSPPSPIGRGSG